MGYSFCINNGDWVDLIEYHLKRCRTYRTVKKGKWSFIFFE